MSWFQKARNFLFPEESKEQQKDGPSGKRGKVNTTKGAAASPAQQVKPPPGARIVKQVIPAPEPVLIEAEAVGKKKAGIQGLLWYAQKQKQDVHGDIANEFLEEADTPSRLTLQHQVKPASFLTVKRVEGGNVVLATRKTKSKAEGLA